MIREKKEENVKKVEELLSSCTIAIVTDYRGMPVSELSKLRRQLKASGIKYHIVKNSLASLAAERTGKEELKNLLNGPSAIAFGYGEVNQPAKVLTDYIRTSKQSLSIRGGVLQRRSLTAADVSALSLLPPREVLVAQLLQQMQKPIYSIVAVLNAELTALTRLLQARKQQLEGG